jgi:predicted Zn-dependent peptidase
MQPKQVPPFTFAPEVARTAPVEVSVYGPDAENLMVGYRMPGANTREAKYLLLVDYLLANSKAGLIDLNLVKKQMVLSASSSTWTNKDYSIHFLTGKPKQGQSMEEVKDLLLEQIKFIKDGAFDEETLLAIINNFKVDQIRNNESNSGRAYTMLDAFIVGNPWNEQVSMLDDLSKITKQEIMDFANKYYTNDYVVVYKKIGEDKSIKKIDKPEITPVEVNRDDMSPFVKQITEAKVSPVKPVYLNYQNDIARGKVGGKVPMLYIKNNDNGLFSLYYVLDMGKFHNVKLPVAVNLLQYLGTDKYSAEQISKEFFKLACDFGVSAGEDQVYVYVSGLDENFAPAVRLFEHLLANAKPDQTALNQMVERMLKQRKDAKLNKQAIFNGALRSYAIFGKKNPYNLNLTEEQLRVLKAEDMVDILKSLTSYHHKILYYGPKRMEEVGFVLNKEHPMPAALKSYPKRAVFKRNNMDKNMVYFVDYKMVQAEIMWLHKQPMGYDSTRVPMINLYNEYFGGGMSSVVFQTIRESKALAYSTFSRYLSPQRKEDPYYVIAYVGTQSDKMDQAITGMNELLTELPKSDASFSAAKEAIRSQIETDRINKEQIFFSYLAAERLGIHRDLRADVYGQLDKMSFDDVKKFHESNIKGKTYTYCIMGSKEKINLQDLKKYGEVKEVTLEELFGY